MRVLTNAAVRVFWVVVVINHQSAFVAMTSKCAKNEEGEYGN